MLVSILHAGSCLAAGPILKYHGDIRWLAGYTRLAPRLNSCKTVCWGQEPGGGVYFEIFDGDVPFLDFSDDLLQNIWSKRHPTLEFLADKETMWRHFFQNLAP